MRKSGLSPPYSGNHWWQLTGPAALVAARVVDELVERLLILKRTGWAQGFAGEGHDESLVTDSPG